MAASSRARTPGHRMRAPAGRPPPSPTAPAPAPPTRRRGHRPGPAAAPGCGRTGRAGPAAAPGAAGSRRAPRRPAAAAFRLRGRSVGRLCSSRTARGPARPPRSSRLAEPFLGEAADGGERLRRLRSRGVTTSSSPRRAPSVATPFRLRALTGPRPLVASATLTPASKPPAVRTRSAAGRAWRPSAVEHGDAERPSGSAGLARPAACRGRATTGPRVDRPRRGGRRPAPSAALSLPTGLDRGGPLWRPGRRGPRRPPLQGFARPGRHRRRDGALHERRRGEQHARAPLLVQQIHGQLGGEDGAAQVHQDQDAVLGPHVLDRAAAPVSRLCPARRRAPSIPPAASDAHLRSGHLARPARRRPPRASRCG